MAVVVSQAQNEVADMAELGSDITPHRRKMNDEDLDTRFKDSDDPFRLVFVCAMWLTGFDAPSTSTIYLDKPMRGHTLMQTIARANRVFPDKDNGSSSTTSACSGTSRRRSPSTASTAAARSAPRSNRPTTFVQALDTAVAEAEDYLASQTTSS